MSLKKLRKNLFLFNTSKFFDGLWMFSAIAIIYFESITNSYALAMVVYSLISIASAVFEIPTSLVSDRWGRKGNLVASALLMLLGMLSWAVAGVYGSLFLLVIGSCLRGVGVAFLSGTGSAFLYETLKDMNATRKFSAAYAKAVSMDQQGLFIAAISCLIATYYNQVLMLAWLSVVTALLKLITVLFLENPSFHKAKDVNCYQQLKRGISLFGKNKKLRKYSILHIFNSSLILNMYRIEALYFVQLVPLYVVSAVRVLTHAFGSVGYYMVGFLKKSNILSVLFYSIIGNCFIRIVAILLNNGLTPFISSFQNSLYVVVSSAQNHLQQKEYNKSLRATMDSVISFGTSIMIGVFGYLFGLFADILSPRDVLIAAVVIQFLIAFSYKRLFEKQKKKRI